MHHMLSGHSALIFHEPQAIIKHQLRFWIILMLQNMMLYNFCGQQLQRNISRTGQKLRYTKEDVQAEGKVRKR